MPDPFIADKLSLLNPPTVLPRKAGWIYEGHWRIGHPSPAVGVTVRVRIDRDFYDHQCSAVVEAWSPDSLTWNHVARLLPSAMHVCTAAASVPKLSTRTLSSAAEAAFDVDAETLLDRARMVLLGGRLAL